MDAHFGRLTSSVPTSRRPASLPDWRVGTFLHNPPPFQVLTGRDIICQGVLNMDFSGRFTFSI